jgi:hypothetical protein
MQCQAKASSVQEVLQLLVGGGRVRSATASGPTASITTVEAAVHDSPAVAALRGCVGTAASLVKAIEQTKCDVFEAWQVRALDECVQRPAGEGARDNQPML